GTVRAPVRWESLYRERLDWWSLKPVAEPPVPDVPPLPVGSASFSDAGWCRNVVDRFILDRLGRSGLSPAAEADRATLARRLSFVLTGLPPDPVQLNHFLANERPSAYDEYVDALLNSPHYGEHWARHWMDVVHYADTHGYEWDVPAKNAWMYRDYLVRAFNRDIPFTRFVEEQIAGDLIEPRVDPVTDINESLVATMALRLGERRHGDNADTEGISQEAISNVIDTIGKTFLGTTLACSQCHDHKLDAVAQADYYALAGTFMSTRWGVRCVDATDRNLATLEALREIKHRIRSALAIQWQDATASLAEKIEKLPLPEKSLESFPETITDFWLRSKGTAISIDEYTQETSRRQAENRTNLTLVADLSAEESDSNWRWQGSGMRHGRTKNGEVIVATDGDSVVMQLVPQGRWSHRWSQRLAGALQSPLLETLPPRTYSLGLAGAKHAAYTFNLDNAYFSERLSFLNAPTYSWLTLTAGDFSTLEGAKDKRPRRVYLELTTKSLNNYFPPRHNYGGVDAEIVADERSWFGVTQIYSHPADKKPWDELGRFAPMFDQNGKFDPSGSWAVRIAFAIQGAVERWCKDQCTEQDVVLLNDALKCGLLPNDSAIESPLKDLVAEYRSVESMLVPDRTVGAMDDWNEGQDEPLAIRGSYTDLGEPIPRGRLGLFEDAEDHHLGRSSGRRELAKKIASPKNPLTARVYVNRIWAYVFGEGIVRTPDDFGHLGEHPSHPELLDYLASQLQTQRLSTKQLVRLLVTSATWRQSSKSSAAAHAVDPGNMFLHHLPMRRLEAEAIRDAILFVANEWNPVLHGPPIDPYRTSEDPVKRLLSGPIDGLGRRSLYLKMTLMEPPRFLALFNQPIPKMTTGRRDVTNVPSQSLALLNDPLVVVMAERWSQQLSTDGAESSKARAASMFVTAFGRNPTDQEVNRIVILAEKCAEMHPETAADLLSNRLAWRDVAHTLFNMQEFIYVR
ncbi:MAG: DUF1549 and DUF1553 domain-containing protein, partial [Planctomycetota bacterium]|nr:DUF1549 and DUF1553 domain-containing protein [Planctomycetota bacterium]